MQGLAFWLLLGNAKSDSPSGEMKRWQTNHFLPLTLSHVRSGDWFALRGFTNWIPDFVKDDDGGTLETRRCGARMMAELCLDGLITDQTLALNASISIDLKALSHRR